MTLQCYIEILVTDNILPTCIVEIVRGDRRLAVRDYEANRVGRMSAQPNSYSRK
jgi:hypothetical protein